MIRRNEKAGFAIINRFAYTADIVSDDRKSVSGCFEINETEAFNAVAMFDAGERKNIDLIVDRAELLVGDVAEEFYGKIGLSGLLLEFGIVAVFRLGACEPIFDLVALLGRKCLQGAKSDHLSFAWVQSTDGEHYYLGEVESALRWILWVEIAPRGSRCDQDLVFIEGKPLAEQLARVIRESAKEAGALE